MAKPVDNLPPIHPGSFLRDELDTLALSARKFAEHIHVPHNAVTGIMNGERSISAQKKRAKRAVSLFLAES